MTNIENLVLEHLKALRSEVAAIKSDTEEIKDRLRSHDASIIELRRTDVHVYEDLARHQVGFDSLLRRIERIEKRLDLFNQ